MFGGKNVFENILQYGENPVHEMMHAAAYILIDHIVFYHILNYKN
jgi:hypothetical protein